MNCFHGNVAHVSVAVKCSLYNSTEMCLHNDIIDKHRET